MSAFLPLFSSPQNGPNAISVNDSGLEPSIQKNPDQTSRSGEASSPVFSQVLRHQYARPTFPTHLQALASTSGQEKVTLPPISPQGDFRNREIGGPSDSILESLGEFQASTTQPNLPTLRPTDVDALPDTTNLLSANISTNETAPGRSENIVFVQASLPVVPPTSPPTPPTDIHAPVNGVLQGRILQQAGGGPNLGQVRQAFEIEGHVSKNPHISLPNIPQSGSVSQQVPQGPDVKAASSGLIQEEASLTRTHVQLVKDSPNGLPLTGRVGLEDEALKTPILQRFSNVSIGPKILQSRDVPPVTAVQQKGPTEFTQTVPTNPLAITPIVGVSSLLNDGSSPTLENRTTVQMDPLGDQGLLNKGDRVHTMVEASLKHVGLDPSGGQGLGNGMNHSPHSQSRFQEPSAFANQGMGVRGVERSPDFPTPTLQRLQMDVQISDTQRVSIDVGVQNRLVSAGLVMDHSVLRNLATQFVPQLENQLSQVDLELKEFSAEVREEREQEAETLFDGAGSHGGQKSQRGSTSVSHSTHNPIARLGEQGLHLVA